MADRLGIIDIRNIIRTILETYNLDLSDYALTSLRRRLEKMMRTNNMGNADDFCLTLKQNTEFFEAILFDLVVEETEMFRDPALWRDLKDGIIPSNFNGNYTIWLPEISTGDELFTLCIMLKEKGILDKVKIIASSISPKNIEFTKAGILDIKKMETNIANYKRAKGQFQLEDYYVQKGNRAQMDTELIKNVEFGQMNIFNDKIPEKIHLVIYRNKMIYFNLPQQTRCLDLIHSSMQLGGFMVIGIKESLDSYNGDRKFLLVNESENIFKKVSV